MKAPAPERRLTIRGHDAKKYVRLEVYRPMRPAYGVLLAMFLVLPGCLADDPSESDQQTTPASDTDGAASGPVTTAAPAGEPQAPGEAANTTTVRNAAGSADVTLTQVRTAVVQNNHGMNCILIDGAAVNRMATLVATLTWQAESPLWTELEFVVSGSDEMRATGASPITITMENLTAHPGYDDYILIAQAASPGAAVDQEATITYEITYAGAANVGHEKGGCIWE